MDLNELRLPYGARVDGVRVGLTLCEGTAEAMSRHVPESYYGVFLEHAARLLLLEIEGDTVGREKFLAWLEGVLDG